LALWYFNPHNWTQIIVSVLLFLNGTLSFFTDTQSKFVIKLKGLLQIIAVSLAVILLIKTFSAG
jgi:hypothetical protein